MKVLILTHGTRGDVQPYAALAYALRAAGHEAVLGAPAASASLGEPYGLPYIPLDDGPNTLIDDPDIREAIETNYRGLRGKKIALTVIKRTKPLMAKVFADMIAAAEGGADVIVHPPGIPAHHIAERLGVPSVPAALQPVWVPTGTFPNPMTMSIRVPKTLNRATYLPTRLLLRSMAGTADRMRRDLLQLPRRRRRHDVLRAPGGGPVTVVQGFSRLVLPPGLDYPSWVHTTGFWYLPAAAGWTPPAELSAFLDAGEPPVYLGFGSMAGTDPHRVGRIVAEAIGLAGVRAVLVSGWGGIRLDDLPENVLLLEQIPHDWLFPRMAAIVHHGGSGTTGAALAAGRPQVVCPFVADQPFWASRMRAMGVAPASQPQGGLTPQGLAGAITAAVTDRRMAERAAVLGERVRAEDGVAATVGILEAVGTGRRGSRPRTW
ncbi:nucleotide disphospho-sugar-binding domain-containing protein [Nonomuraea diastatica]|uniref:Glycosyltransferase n=1 Tax=Nonomuraea diastatica TaxID=1848329 RepID=A0A4R4WFJ8_9ACTN|nr:glycosyltransferase [Nonomuraea diastatica]TDD17749.1 glycosyltransferase [Nonomuraea diastatica]